ncbi:hypothetical protein BC829DRAFT_191605 [Chytridium lagenaria]|nr:hypothetical protein BC829DRAFT_191605 [Chytridium lagenaria]
MGEDREKRIIEAVLVSECLYARLGVPRDAASHDVRRAYLLRSKLCHPDRLDHPKAKEACKLSSAYQTLSDTQARQAYDLYGSKLMEVNKHLPMPFLSFPFQQVFSEFLAGHFDSLMRMLEYVQSIHPDVNISKERARQIFGSMREFILWSGDCWEQQSLKS